MITICAPSASATSQLARSRSCSSACRRPPHSGTLSRHRANRTPRNMVRPVSGQRTGALIGGPRPDAAVAHNPGMAEPDVRITEYPEPGWPWAYSAEPFRRRLNWLYGERLEWKARMVGLAGSPKEYAKKG